MQGTSVRFASAARTLGRIARERGCEVPAFRSPPRVDGVDRTLKRDRRGHPIVAVRTSERPWAAVLADMIEGVVVANGLGGAEATRLRTAMWSALEPHLEPCAA